MTQLIQEPTLFTENSSPWLDLVFTNIAQFVILSGVGESFLDQNLRYHCPVFAVLKFDKHKQPCYKRKIWKYDDANYVLLNQLVCNFDWSEIKCNNIDSYASNFTEKLLEFCSLSIPNKCVTFRPSAPPGLNNHVRRAISKRKRAHRRAKRLSTDDSWKLYRHLRNESINAIRTAKHEHKTNLANKLLDNIISTKDWWIFFKICLGKDAKENIPLHYQNQAINNPKDKAYIFNVFFHSQSLLDETNKDIPTLSEPINTLESIHLEIEEVCSILKSLQVG